MKTKSYLLWLCVIIIGCATKENERENVSGVYVREYSFTITNQETGAELGMRTVRDTIFVNRVGDSYDISNRKWMMNHYDQEGWRNMEHSDDRPFESYGAKFDRNSSELIAEGHPPFQIAEDILTRDDAGKVKYMKVK